MLKLPFWVMLCRQDKTKVLLLCFETIREDKSERAWQGQQQGDNALSMHLNKWEEGWWTLALCVPVAGHHQPVAGAAVMYLAQVSVQAGMPPETSPVLCGVCGEDLWGVEQHHAQSVGREHVLGHFVS